MDFTEVDYMASVMKCYNQIIGIWRPVHPFLRTIVSIKAVGDQPIITIVNKDDGEEYGILSPKWKNGELSFSYYVPSLGITNECKIKYDDKKGLLWSISYPEFWERIRGNIKRKPENSFSGRWRIVDNPAIIDIKDNETDLEINAFLYGKKIKETKVRKCDGTLFVELHYPKLRFPVKFEVKLQSKNRCKSIVADTVPLEPISRMPRIKIPFEAKMLRMSSKERERSQLNDTLTNLDADFPKFILIENRELNPKLRLVDGNDGEEFIVKDARWDKNTILFSYFVPSTKINNKSRISIDGGGDLLWEVTSRMYFRKETKPKTSDLDRKHQFFGKWNEINDDSILSFTLSKEGRGIKIQAFHYYLKRFVYISNQHWEGEELCFDCRFEEWDMPLRYRFILESSDRMICEVTTAEILVPTGKPFADLLKEIPKDRERYEPI